MNLSTKVLISCLVLILIGAMIIPSSTAAQNLDQYIRERVLASETPGVDQSMHYLTKLGDREVALPLLFAIPTEARIDSFKSLAVSMSVTQLLKMSIGKKRPPGPVEYRPFAHDTSYQAMPSGHATGIFAIATILADYYPSYQWPTYTLASLVSISRLYEDKHWFSDVAAGAGIGYLGGKFVLKHW